LVEGELGQHFSVFIPHELDFRDNTHFKSIDLNGICRHQTVYVIVNRIKFPSVLKQIVPFEEIDAPNEQEKSEHEDECDLYLFFDFYVG
jgi:hypothetical protein